MCVPPPREANPSAQIAGAPTSRKPCRCLASLAVEGEIRPAPPVVPAPSEGQDNRGPEASTGDSVKLADSEAKAKLLRRVRRVEGQARGVARMIEEDRDCSEILQQLAAVRSAAHQATVSLVRSYATECVVSDASAEEIADALAVALSRLA